MRSRRFSSALTSPGSRCGFVAPATDSSVSACSRASRSRLHVRFITKANSIAQEGRRDLGFRLAIQRSARVHLSHGHLVDSPAKSIQRLSDRVRQIVATDDDGVIDRVEAGIVLERRKIVV